ncbi:MAG: M50 family metallopeptidase [Myxococcales bacterium]|nr:M50 family metallopeptidase [Myxococcales bacterium]
MVFLGHAALRLRLARAIGLEVHGVRVGWGPRIHGRTTEEGMRVEIRALPPLAMVSLAGHDALEGGPSYQERFGRRDLAKRALITLYSPVYYFGLTVLPLFAIATLWGWPGEAVGTMEVEQAFEGLPAESAGIRAGDVLTHIEGDDVETPAQVIERVTDSGGLPLHVRIRRDGEELEVELTPQLQRGRHIIGIRFQTLHSAPRLDAITALAEASRAAAEVPIRQLEAAYAEYSHVQVEGLAGPVGMGRVAGDPEQRALVSTVALVSAFLGSFLLWVWLPFRFCTGGRLLLLAPEVLGLRQPGARAERWMNASGWLLYGAVVGLDALSSFGG